jgi:hypothetical protein
MLAVSTGPSRPEYAKLSCESGNPARPLAYRFCLPPEDTCSLYVDRCTLFSIFQVFASGDWGSANALASCSEAIPLPLFQIVLKQSEGKVRLPVY